MTIESTSGGDRRATATDGAPAPAGPIAEGIATLAGALAELPSIRATSLADVERSRVARLLSRGWDLAAFTSTGALVLAVVDAAGARIEVAGGGAGAWGSAGARPAVFVEGEGMSEGEGAFGGVVRAAWGAPPGRRVTAMGIVPAPGGGVMRASCGLVLRIPAAAVDEPLRIAAMLAFHAAMYAAERRSLPAAGELVVALDQLELELGLPRGPRGRVAWADRVTDLVVEELGGIDGPMAPPDAGCANENSTYSGY